MGRYYNLGERVITPQDNVTSLLPLKVESSLLESPHYLVTRKAARQPGHVATTSASMLSLPTSVGTGSPSSMRAST